jgi:hypothetical protein
MKKSVFALVMISVLTSCSKNSSNTDNTVGWVGTYTNGLNPHGGINRVVISKVDNNDLQVQVQYDTASYITTVATFRKATIVNSTTFAVNENDSLAGISDSTFNFVSTGALSGNSLILSGSATNIAAPADVKNFYFTGNK